MCKLIPRKRLPGVAVDAQKKLPPKSRKSSTIKQRAFSDDDDVFGCVLSGSKRRRLLCDDAVSFVWLWKMFSRVPQIGKYTKSIRGQRSTALLSVWDHSSLCDARERYATDGLVNICTDVYHFFWGRFVVVTPFYWCKNAKLSAWFFTNKLQYLVQNFLTY